MHQENALRNDFRASGPNETSTSEANDPGEMGTLEEGFSTMLSVQDANTETGIVFRDLENSQSHEKQDPVILSYEQEHRQSSNHEFSVQEAHTETGSKRAFSDNMQSDEKQYPAISSDEQELRLLSNHGFSVQEAHTKTGSGHALSDIMQSYEKHDQSDEQELRLLSNNDLSVQEAHTETESGTCSENFQSEEKYDLGIFTDEQEGDNYGITIFLFKKTRFRQKTEMEANEMYTETVFVHAPLRICNHMKKRPTLTCHLMSRKADDYAILIRTETETRNDDSISII